MRYCPVLLQLTLIALLSYGVESLQCYNCRGMTNYDPDQCENPVIGETILQECTNNEVCEKKVYHIDRFHDVISRGCSGNCGDRTYIYTDDFQVHCCGDNLCNQATRKHSEILLLVCPVILLLFRFWTTYLQF